MTTKRTRPQALTPRYFATPDAFRAWLEENHDTATELLVGFHKRKTKEPSMTWPESVDQALCFGWIDGVRRRIDDDRYSIRFTPRKRGSHWSAVNVKRVSELVALGRMRDAGLRAFEARDEKKTARASYEQAVVAFPAGYEARFRRNRAAWTWWQAQAPWYRKAATHWVTSAKQEATRERRLATLIDDCANERRIKPLSY